MHSLATKGPVISSYTTTQAQRAAGITTRQLWHWMTQQVIEPSVAKAGGAGGTNMWSEDDVAVLSMLGELARLGVEAENLRLVQPQLRILFLSGPPELVVISRSPIEAQGVRVSNLARTFRESEAAGFWVLDLRRLRALRSA